LLGHHLYGGTLLYMAIDGFRHNHKRVEIARDRGVPLPELAVPLATGMLLVVTLLLVLWAWPVVAALLVVVFFLATTLTTHPFWEFEGKERNDNKINFLQNVALTSAAILFLGEALGADGDGVDEE
jgi:uncharacterized membrane protein YphA (DoxX/SURF4 family)